MKTTTKTTAIPLCYRCFRQHRHYRTVARCAWPRALWICGNGPWASVSRCHPGSTIQLYRTEAEALKAKALIDRLACGGRCRREHHHHVVNLDTLLARWEHQFHYEGL